MAPILYIHIYSYMPLALRSKPKGWGFNIYILHVQGLIEQSLSGFQFFFVNSSIMLTILSGV